jgi:hypothetical protein
MYDEYGILTSDGIQKRFAEATERRTFVRADRRYLLITAPSNWVFDDRNSINVDNNSVNVDNNTQSKVNKSKVNYLYSASAGAKRENAKQGRDSKERSGSFDVDDFFAAAVKKALGDN